MLFRHQLLTMGCLLFSSGAWAQSPTPAPSQPAPTASQELPQSPIPNKPLYVVNGQPMPEAFRLADIPARYIKETKILTGTPATAIGGARAAHGLVLITTKRRYRPAAN